MSDLGCDAVVAHAPELVLGLLDGHERAALLEHVRTCSQCQTLVADLAETGDLLTLLAPEAEPPPGFGERVVQSITAPVRRSRRRRFLVVAAVAAAAAVLSVATVRIVDAGRTGTPAAAPALHTAPMIDANGLKVGSVAVSGSDPARIAVTVDYAVPDEVYTVVLDDRHGTESVGTIQVADGHGEWKGTASIGEGRVHLGMVDADGTRVCAASLA
jgi:predicted anti-sigma-YlaC factor YlaD